MSERYVEIDIPRGGKGEFKVAVHGCDGNACYDLTKGLQASIGGQTVSDAPVPYEKEQEIVSAVAG